MEVKNKCFRMLLIKRWEGFPRGKCHGYGKSTKDYGNNPHRQVYNIVLLGKGSGFRIVLYRGEFGISEFYLEIKIIVPTYPKTLFILSWGIHVGNERGKRNRGMTSLPSITAGTVSVMETWKLRACSL
uniref:Uncharacterized protein n=1 Tax=Oryza sativa subsp. japonica TaxID=39947 RepID=Q33BF3_ORYSJ|nr:hypothetical protein LOC_Os10g02330 [Oryza sativa Japonica Group]